ncbi:MAG: hypothetical protein FJY73_12725 [Candidatus Eisenbacteria bacterium]|nr:hypothetical protein [Candidatus Eisenbacteria bacterium]
MSSGRASFRSHEEGTPRNPAFVSSSARRRAWRKKGRWISVFLYALLILLNFAVLSLFGPGELADDIARIFGGARETAQGAPKTPVSSPGQFPPGESWDTSARSSEQPGAAPR